MNRRHLICLGLLLTTIARGAAAADVMMYRAGEQPDPRALAAILSHKAIPPGIKMRSIRLLPDAPAAAAAAAAPAEPARAERAEEREVTRTAAIEAPAATPDSFALPVPFAFDSARILPEATPQLDAVVAGIKLAGPDVHVLVEGHTDARGSDAYNDALSYRRAEAVKTYLVAHGIAPTRLHVVGMGKAMPLNASDPTAAENRRVQFRPMAEAERMASLAPKRG